MGRLGRTCSFAPLLPPSAPAFVASSPQITWRGRSHRRLSFDRQHGGRRRGIAAVAAAVEQQPAGGGGGGGEGVHSEQKTGYQPPSPLEDDGHVVDLSLLQDLLESGTLQVARRPADYSDRRSDGYTEPLEVYVLGTSHASETSAGHVRRVVEAVRPQSVVVELCKSRAGLMMPVAPENEAGSNNPLAMSGENFASSLARSIRIGGQSTALLRAALAWAARGSMADGQETMRSGGEGTTTPTSAVMYGDFRAAKEGAEEARIACSGFGLLQVQVGSWTVVWIYGMAWYEDHRGGLTSDSAASTWYSPSTFSRRERTFRSRGSACQECSGSSDTQQQQAIQRGGGGGGGGGGRNSGAAEKLRKSVSDGEVGEDALEDLISMLAERFPSVVGPLIYERDLYLAWTLKRSRAVCGQRRVVGVVGRGHLAGVMRAVETDRGGDTLVFKTLTGKQGGEAAAKGGGGGGLEWPYSSSPSKLEKGAKFAARLGLETAAGYALWELYKAVTTSSAT
ncbi:conserved unknown protein [Ectocarpus siliculosus]|uniref:TraB domain-containing protein n=1 Tax=Ectocarpus siliculosus TaxID=2880 RepID=D7FS36_ECTSI|nr:conserved unknown protein [Ectocarpus siliculosus]|eukprot:CBJ30977.1 conserved unknown protein [Ectocarpus siliculosus]